MAKSEKVQDMHRTISKAMGDIEHVDLVSNKNAKIGNPLHGLTTEQVLAGANAFVDELDDSTFVGGRDGEDARHMREYFRKGALVAQYPNDWDKLPELTEDDKAALVSERDHKWRHPRALYWTILICSIGACVQGWDQTGSNGANLSTTKVNGEKNQWIVGVINAAPYIGSAFAGCWLADPINNWVGRRGCIFISGIVLILTPIGSAVCQTWYQLFICRLIMGLGMGAKGATVPPYAAENSPPMIRGALVMSWQLWTAFGIFLGTAANIILYQVGSIAWRLQLGSAFLPAVPLAALIYLCPESPRWYLKKGRYGDALRSFRKLRNHDLLAARDMFYAHLLLQEELTIMSGSSFVTRFFELFTVPRIRRATLASFVVMLGQQMCGINIMAFYSSSIFSQAGYSTSQSLWVSFGFGLTNFVFAFPAIFTIDTFGRRSLLLVTFPQMAWTLFAAAGCFYISPESQARIALVAFFVFLFTAFYSVGEGPVPFAYSAEVFPLSHREVGMAWAVSTCLFWAAVLSITFPRMLVALTPSGSFFFYGGLNMIAFVMIFFFVPETKQRTLEELDYVFAVPTGKHMSYHITKTAPWFIQRWILFRKNAKLEPLYDDSDLSARRADAAHADGKKEAEFRDL